MQNELWYTERQSCKPKHIRENVSPFLLCCYCICVNYFRLWKIVFLKFSNWSISWKMQFLNVSYSRVISLVMLFWYSQSSIFMWNCFLVPLHRPSPTVLLRACQQNSTLHTTCDFYTLTSVIQEPQTVYMDGNLSARRQGYCQCQSNRYTSDQSREFLDKPVVLLQSLCRSTAVKQPHPCAFW